MSDAPVSPIADADVTVAPSTLYIADSARCGAAGGDRNVGGVTLKASHKVETFRLDKSGEPIDTVTLCNAPDAATARALAHGLAGAYKADPCFISTQIVRGKNA